MGEPRTSSESDLIRRNTFYLSYARTPYNFGFSSDVHAEPVEAEPHGTLVWEMASLPWTHPRPKR